MHLGEKLTDRLQESSRFECTDAAPDFLLVYHGARASLTQWKPPIQLWYVT